MAAHKLKRRPAARLKTASRLRDDAIALASFASPEIEAARLLHLIGTPEALAAVDELIEVGERRCAAFRRAAEILLAAVPAPVTSH